MKRPVSQAIALYSFSILLSASYAKAQTQDFSTYDLSTKAGVNAAREAMTGKKLDDRSKNCVRIESDLPGVVAVGGFAYDRGCRFEGAFVKSRYFGNEDASLSKSALDALGWMAASSKQREKFAQVWVEKGLLAFLTVLSAKNEDFANHSFQAPQAVSQPNGEIVVRLWIRLPSGRSRGRNYQQREHRFSSSGNLLSTRTVESFSTVKDEEG